MRVELERGGAAEEGCDVGMTESVILARVTWPALDVTGGATSQSAIEGMGRRALMIDLFYRNEDDGGDENGGNRGGVVR